MTAATHPLFGSVVGCSHFRRVDGVVFLVVTLPDGSPGTIRADATDVLGAVAEKSSGTVLDPEGLRLLLALVTRMQPPRGSGRAAWLETTNRFDPLLIAPTNLGR